MNASLVKCRCNSCSQYIEFEPQQAGQTIACPYCNLDTMLFVPRMEPPKTAPPNPHLRPCPYCHHEVSRTAEACPQCGGILAREQTSVSNSTIACSYVLAVLIPLLGFFAGIYLMTKKESGHGIVVIVLSIIVAAIIASLI
jgi:DNA-directed RNA polymerase subunit RPC12/RpoP/predicted nucleic acid-binding Zn ribbon protein